MTELLPNSIQLVGTSVIPAARTYAQLEFTHAAAFCTWLADHGHHPATLTQVDLDRYYTALKMGHRQSLRGFLNWSITSQNLPKLSFARPRFTTGEALTQSDRVALLRRQVGSWFTRAGTAGFIGTRLGGRCQSASSHPDTAGPGHETGADPGMTDVSDTCWRDHPRSIRRVVRRSATPPSQPWPCSRAVCRVGGRSSRSSSSPDGARAAAVCACTRRAHTAGCYSMIRDGA
jgi:hypothetical protein